MNGFLQRIKNKLLVLKANAQNQDDGAEDAEYEAYLETGDDSYIYGYNDKRSEAEIKKENDPNDPNYEKNRQIASRDTQDINDARAAAYDAYSQTGDDAYLYGNNYPKGSREHRLWASIYQPGLYKSFNNQNNAGNNQYQNPDKALPEVSNALNTTAPVNGSFSTSNMEQQKLQRSSGNYNAQSQNANPTGENGINTANISSTSTQTTVPDISKFKNEIQSTPKNELNMSEGVVANIKKQLEELGEEYTRKDVSNASSYSPPSANSSIKKEPMAMEEVERELKNLPREMFKSIKGVDSPKKEEKIIEDEPNELPLPQEKEREINRFFEPDKMVELMEEEKTEKSLRIKLLLKSLSSLSETEGLFRDIKNARKYAKIFNTKLALLGEHAELSKPTLSDIKKFGKKVSVRVNINKY